MAAKDSATWTSNCRQLRDRIESIEDCAASSLREKKARTALPIESRTSSPAMILPHVRAAPATTGANWFVCGKSAGATIVKRT